MRKPFAAVLGLLFVASSLPAQPTGEARLLRFPAIHGDRVVFTYAGDLYTVSAQGGIARRLTSHDGFEMFARFAPDGKTLAFTGQYDGNTEVFIMPSDGGIPRRLTYTATLARDDVSDRMGPNNIVMGWKNKDEILFRGRMKDPNDFCGQLYTVSVKGGLPQQVAVPRGGFASFSPDGGKMAYNRIFREFRTWKRYRGGMADDVWIYDFATKKIENVTDNPACDTFPMWAGDKIYFLSDRDEHKRFNLYVCELAKKTTRQLTHYTDYDVKYPSLGGDQKAIVYENAGYIYKFDLATEKAEKVPVQIREDFAASRTVLKDVSKNIMAYEISPDGKRALFDARGDIFTVPVKEGQTRNLTATPGVHERDPKWSPDGKWIAFISDLTGEDEIHIVPADGKGADKQITSVKTLVQFGKEAGTPLGPTYLYNLYWSPDSTKILWADKKMRLLYVDIKTKEIHQAAQGKRWEIHDYVWAPDSKWIAFARPDDKTLDKIWLYSLDNGKATEVTDGWYDSSHPRFSGDGKYLFFVSDRDFRPSYSAVEWDFAYADMSRVYFATLAKDTRSPFAPKSDDETAPAKKDDAKKEEKKDGAKKEEPKKDEAAKKPVKIDLDGLGHRIVQLPIPPANYGDLQSVGVTVYYMRSSGRNPDAKGGLYMYDLAAKKETALGQIGGFEISANGQKMLVYKDNAYAIIDLPKGSISMGETLKLSGLQVNLDWHQEWREIFRESWRQMRDFFYAPNMNGVDWKAMRDRYEPLVEHVNHRADLTYVIGEMISELDAGHCYVGGGDYPHPRRIPMGLLGAELQQDEKTKYYKITRILKGSSWESKYRSPLTDLGVDVNEGEYIIAVNGRPVNEMVNIYESLINTAGKQVRLRVNKAPAQKGSREVLVVPIADEQPLYYYNWVQGNIKKVSDATAGRVG